MEEGRIGTTLTHVMPCQQRGFVTQLQVKRDCGYNGSQDTGNDAWMHVPYWVRCLRLMVMMAVMVDGDGEDNH